MSIQARRPKKMMKELTLSDKTSQLVADILQAMAHPIRLKILAGLCESECNVNRLWHKLNISQPLASQHLNRMRRAGLIQGERKGQEICYRIVDKKVKQIVKQLCDMVETSHPS